MEAGPQDPALHPLRLINVESRLEIPPPPPLPDPISPPLLTARSFDEVDDDEVELEDDSRLASVLDAAAAAAAAIAGADCCEDEDCDEMYLSETCSMNDVPYFLKYHHSKMRMRPEISDDVPVNAT